MPLKPEMVKLFMEKTGEDRIKTEKFLDAADGDVKRALVSWMETSTGFDYDTVFPRPRPILRN